MPPKHTSLNHRYNEMFAEASIYLVSNRVQFDKSVQSREPIIRVTKNYYVKIREWEGNKKSFTGIVVINFI